MKLESLTKKKNLHYQRHEGFWRIKVELFGLNVKRYV